MGAVGGILGVAGGASGSGYQAPAQANIINPVTSGIKENPYITKKRAALYNMEPFRSNFSPLHTAHSPFNFQKVSARTVKPTGIIKRKRLLQPKTCVIIPPKTGPNDKLTYTEVIVIPRAFPLSFGGNTWVTIAMLVTNIIADPIP